MQTETQMIVEFIETLTQGFKSVGERLDALEKDKVVKGYVSQEKKIVELNDKLKIATDALLKCKKFNDEDYFDDYMGAVIDEALETIRKADSSGKR